MSTNILTVRVLPGPNRKRHPEVYVYRVTHREPDRSDPGCVMTWDVVGGRSVYQVALERTATDQVRWHCTCADAVYRGETDPNHRCKHVKGILESLPMAA